MKNSHVLVFISIPDILFHINTAMNMKIVTLIVPKKRPIGRYITAFDDLMSAPMPINTSTQKSSLITALPLNIRKNFSTRTHESFVKIFMRKNSIVCVKSIVKSESSFRKSSQSLNHISAQISSP